MGAVAVHLARRRLVFRFGRNAESARKRRFVKARHKLVSARPRRVLSRTDGWAWNDKRKDQRAARRRAQDDDGRRSRWSAFGPRVRHHLRAPGRSQRRLLRCAGAKRRQDSDRAYAARTGRCVPGAWRGTRDRQTAGLLRCPRAGLAQLVGGASHRLRHERAGAGAVRANPAERHRPRLLLSARNPRPGRHYCAAGRLVGAHQCTARSAAPRRQGDTIDVHRPARPGGARMRDRRVGALGHGPRAGAAAGAPAADRRRRDQSRGETARRRQASTHRRRCCPIGAAAA